MQTQMKNADLYVMYYESWTDDKPNYGFTYVKNGLSTGVLQSIKSIGYYRDSLGKIIASCCQLPKD